MLTSNEFEFALAFFYFCWFRKVNTKSKFGNNLGLFKKYSEPIMKDLVYDIKPYLKESDKIYYHEYLNVKNLLNHCLHRKIKQKQKE